MENETEAVIDVFVTLSFSLLVVITPFSSRLSVILRHYCLSLSVCPIQSALSLSLSLSLLNCPHSPACQPCHFLFAEGAIKIPMDWNLFDSSLSIKKVTMNSPESLQPTVRAAARHKPQCP